MRTEYAVIVPSFHGPLRLLSTPTVEEVVAFLVNHACPQTPMHVLTQGNEEISAESFLQRFDEGAQAESNS